MVLLIIFLTLLAYVYFFEIQGARRKLAQKENEELVLDLDSDSVAGLTFLPEKIVVEKDRGKWKLLSPVRAGADQTTIASLLDAFSRLKRGRFVSDNPRDYDKFGLAPFQSALVINGTKGRSDTLFIGDTNLDSTNVFYRISGSNRVYLVPATLKDYINKSLRDLRDKTDE